MKTHQIRTLSALSLAAVSFTFSLSAQAHISYSGRDFGTLSAGSNISIANQTVSSNYGWADASDISLAFNSTLASTLRTDDAAFVSGVGTDDLYLGDSHKGRAFKLHLDSALSVTFTVSSVNASGVASGLTSAFSVYQGLASPAAGAQTSADHDYAAASQAWRTSFAQAATGSSSYDYLATNGSWNALGNWSIGGDGDPSGVASALDNFVYVGSAFSTIANGIATTTLNLGPGDYTVFVGGNSIASKSLTDSIAKYGFTLGVSAVPEPESLALALAGLACMGGSRLRRTRD